ncbi:MAG TPA: EcsC family protein, partial [Methylovirgula sp.]|nr:EcsC family protein [Methylovirgula sp.]
MNSLPISIEPSDPSGLSAADYAVLRQAVFKLEHMSFATRLTQAVGQQIDRLGKLLPGDVGNVVENAAQAAIKAALGAALSTLRSRSAGERRLLHKAV